MLRVPVESVVAEAKADDQLPTGNGPFAVTLSTNEEVRFAADQLAAFTQIMMARYPTTGRPIVTGVSQGGSMAYALAAYHPEAFIAAVRLALDSSLNRSGEEPAPP